mgnify:CR=1 FL=1
MDDIEKLISVTIDCGFRIHKRLGPGLFESVYEALLYESLVREGLAVERQKVIDIAVDGLTIPNAFRADIFVENTLLVEVKAVEQALPVHKKQVLTYLRVLDLPLGLITNFGEAMFKTGIHRVFNPLCVFPSS